MQNTDNWPRAVDRASGLLGGDDVLARVLGLSPRDIQFLRRDPSPPPQLQVILSEVLRVKKDLSAS
jgi:hypothetical protein